MRSRSALVASIIAVTLSIAAIASARLTKAGAATAAFKVGGPAGMNIEGRTSTVSVSEEGNTVAIVVALPTLTTGIGLRDKHMKDDLEVERYPTAELRVARSALRVPPPGAEVSGDARGSMRLHGQAKDVSFHYSAKRDGNLITVHGTARIDMTEFGIKAPTYLGLGIKREVDLTTDFVAKED
jgi:polyisoprenoid-binding protein YceI